MNLLLVTYVLDLLADGGIRLFREPILAGVRVRLQDRPTDGLVQLVLDPDEIEGILDFIERVTVMPSRSQTWATSVWSALVSPNGAAFRVSRSESYSMPRMMGFVPP